MNFGSYLEDDGHPSDWDSEHFLSDDEFISSSSSSSSSSPPPSSPSSSSVPVPLHAPYRLIVNCNDVRDSNVSRAIYDYTNFKNFPCASSHAKKKLAILDEILNGVGPIHNHYLDLPESSFTGRQSISAIASALFSSQPRLFGEIYDNADMVLRELLYAENYVVPYHINLNVTHVLETLDDVHTTFRTIIDLILKKETKKDAFESHKDAWAIQAFSCVHCVIYLVILVLKSRILREIYTLLPHDEEIGYASSRRSLFLSNIECRAIFDLIHLCSYYKQCKNRKLGFKKETKHLSHSILQTLVSMQDFVAVFNDKKKQFLETIYCVPCSSIDAVSITPFTAPNISAPFFRKNLCDALGWDDSDTTDVSFMCMMLYIQCVCTIRLPIRAFLHLFFNRKIPMKKIKICFIDIKTQKLLYKTS